MKQASSVVCLGCLATVGFLMAQSEPPFEANSVARATIYAVDEFGKTIPCILISFVQVGNGKNFADRFTNLRTDQIPYGRYRYVLKRENVQPDLSTIEGLVWIDKPESLILSQSERQPHHEPSYGPYTTVTGRIEPLPPGVSAKEPMWVKLSHLQSGGHQEVEVDPSGEFRIYDWLYGMYILAVIQGDKILDVQPLFFDKEWSPARFVIRLDKPPIVQHAEQAAMK